MNKRIALLFASMLYLFNMNQVLAHAEHDRARFVSASGKDQGDCKNRFRPCASIGYAAAQANKGDPVLVAQGTYTLNDLQDVFYLISDLVPVFGGYQQVDNYQIQNPSQFTTTLVGVPAEYAASLYAKGFKVIVDSKGISAQLQQQVKVAHASRSKQDANTCENGMAGNFSCQQVDLLGHVPVQELHAASSAANDIWGHTDLNNMREYALVGMRSGISVVDVTEASSPQVIGTISGQSAVWRDLKVYQYFDTNIQAWRAYAYSTVDSASEGLSIIDLNDLPNSVSLVTRQLDDPAAHNIYISNVDYSLNINNAPFASQVHILGAADAGGSLKSYSLSNPIELAPTHRFADATRSDYSHDASSVFIGDERATRDCRNANQDGCTVLLDFNERSLRLWDHSNLSRAVELSDTTYPNANYTHSGWWTEDKQYVLVHDELDEQRAGLNTTVRVFDISSLSAPELIATWTGETPAIDHNGFVLGNKYYMSTYERGLTVLDISDPSAPKELGFFDSFPSNDSNSFNGAWGVYPYLPSGNILLSDIQGGLFILRDKTQAENMLPVYFPASEYTVDEGEDLHIAISLPEGTRGSVDYQLIYASASADDIALGSEGTLTWQANQATQTITLRAITDDIGEHPEYAFVRLNNPRDGLTLKAPYLAKVTINSVTNAQSRISPIETEWTVKEIDQQLSIPLLRSGDLQAASTVNIAFAKSTSDLTLQTSSLSWNSGESGEQDIILDIIDDDLLEPSETIELVISTSDDTILERNMISITILDDESNQAPIVSLPTSINSNTRQAISISAEASDPEGAELRYQWQQSAGDTVTVQGANTPTINFTAPDSAQTLVFTVQVSDDFGLSSAASVNVNVVSPPAAVVAESPSGGGGSMGILFITTSVLVLIRRQSFGK